MTLYEETLLQLFQKDSRLVLMTAENRAPMRTLYSMVRDRFIDVGIAEQTMVGMAAGLALRGRRPIVHALAAFLTMRSFEFIRTDVGIPSLPVILVGFVPGILSDANGPTHQAIEDISLMRHIPSVNVFCPQDQSELTQALPEIISTNQPWYIRFPQTQGEKQQLSTFKLMSPNILKKGNQVCIFTYGTLVRQALDASAILEQQHISAQVVNMHTIKPLDEEFITACLNKFSTIVVLEDHLLKGGLSSAIAELRTVVASQNVANNLASILPLTLGEQWFRASLLPEVFDTTGFTPEKIATTIFTHLKK